MKYHDHLSLEDLWARILLGLDVMHDAVQHTADALLPTDYIRTHVPFRKPTLGQNRDEQ